MALIGPGHLVLVVGPSGAGKDTLLNLIAAAGVPDVGVARRVVTRPASGAEAHDTLSHRAFDDAAAAGAFTVDWEAYGNRYGIPVSVEAAIRAGRTVLCNASRGVVAELRGRYARISVVLVTAPREMLAARLQHRDAHAGGSVAARLARADAAAYRLSADLVIDNVGTPDVAAKKLLDFLHRSRR